MNHNDIKDLNAQYGNEKQTQQQEQIQQQQQEEIKNSILAQVLNQQARARLNTLKISRPDKAEMVENMIVRMAQLGQLHGKLDDETFINILESINAQLPQNKATVKYDRRRAALDSDEDYGC